MNKEIVAYKEGKFVDYEGKERNVIVCAVSCPPVDKSGATAAYGYEGELEDSFILHGTFGRKLCIGYSVCTPPDVHDEQLGKIKAYGCAKSRRGRVLFATHAGLINTAMVDALLEQELKYLCENPEAVIYRYALDKAKWEDAQEVKKYFDNLSDAEKDAVKAGVNGYIDLMDLANLVDDIKATSANI